MLRTYFYILNENIRIEYNSDGTIFIISCFNDERSVATIVLRLKYKEKLHVNVELLHSSRTLTSAEKAMVVYIERLFRILKLDLHFFKLFIELITMLTNGFNDTENFITTYEKVSTWKPYEVL